MLRSTIRMRIPNEKRSEALLILEALSEQVQFEAGCISCRLYCGVEDADVILLEELWLNAEELHRHLRSDRYREVLLVVEMASESPEIRFDTIAKTSGMETIEEARKVRAG